MKRKIWDKSKLDVKGEFKRLGLLTATFLPAYINAIPTFQIIVAVAIVLYLVGGNPLHPIRAAKSPVIIEKLADILLVNFFALALAILIFVIRTFNQSADIEGAFWGMGTTLAISIPLAQLAACIKYLYVAKRCTSPNDPDEH